MDLCDIISFLDRNIGSNRVSFNIQKHEINKLFDNIIENEMDTNITKI